jgi:hypothetical protein
MKQTCLENAKKDEKGIAGQARNDKPCHMKHFFPLLLAFLWVATNQAQDAVILENYFQSVSKNTTGNRMVNTALFFLDTPYVANTLDVNDEEKLVINLRELDCMTFVENCLALVRALQYSHPNAKCFERELREIRYRNGIINGYGSRLHYTTDWIFDNAGKGVFRDMSDALGGHPLKLNVNFMSTNSQKYPHLANNPEEVKRIEAVEQEITNHRNYYYIPKQDINKCQARIKDGDIICFTTSIPGLDISHLGIAYWYKKQLTFIHASTKAKKVIINPESLADYCRMMKSNTGIIVLRQ